VNTKPLVLSSPRSGVNAHNCDHVCVTQPICQNGGTCHADMDSFQCQCSVGYTGMLCNKRKNIYVTHRRCAHILVTKCLYQYHNVMQSLSLTYPCHTISNNTLLSRNPIMSRSGHSHTYGDIHLKCGHTVQHFVQHVLLQRVCNVAEVESSPTSATLRATNYVVLAR